MVLLQWYLYTYSAHDVSSWNANWSIIRIGVMWESRSTTSERRRLPRGTRASNRNIIGIFILHLLAVHHRLTYQQGNSTYHRHLARRAHTSSRPNPGSTSLLLIYADSARTSATRSDRLVVSAILFVELVVEAPFNSRKKTRCDNNERDE